MKFDYVIGNPPYQEEAETESKTNGQKPRKNIFQHFQIEADKIARKSTVLIYPGIRWMHQTGKGLKQFGFEQINDPHLKTVVFYPKSSDVFSNTDIPDGITIVAKDKTKVTSGFNYVYKTDNQFETILLDNPGEELIPLNPKDSKVLAKVNSFVKNTNLPYLHDGILPRSLFGIDSDFIENNPGLAKEYVPNSEIDPGKEIKIFTNDKAGAAGRGQWFVIDKNLIKQNQAYISEWQVVVSSAHGGGQDGRDNQLSIIDNHSAFGRTRVALKSFKTKTEAENFYKYVKTYIVRYTFLMTDEALTALGKRVPDLVDYTDTNSLVDFSQPLDSQMFKLCNLTKEEQDFVIQSVLNSGKKDK